MPDRVEEAPAVTRIVVGVDGSTFAAMALEWAAALARPVDAEVVALHAAGLLEHLEGATPVPVEGHRAEIEAAFSEWCAPLRCAGVRWRARIVYGPPVSTLIAAIAEEDADVVVVGSRGTGALPELRLGSTSHQLAEHAGRPVLIVPPRARHPGTGAPGAGA